jgi:hypothetical protein
MKITPEINKFIEDNNKLSARALSGLIEQKFNLKVSHKGIEPYLQKARADAQANNSAKIEAVRAKILGDADEWANKYLQYHDEEVEALRNLKLTGKQVFEDKREIKIEDIKDRISVSQALHKHLTTIIEFVKPGGGAPLPDDDLDAKLDALIERRKARIN